MRGTVTKKGNKWYIAVDVGHDEKGKRKQRWFSGFKTKKEAQAKLSEVLQQLNTGTYVDCDNITLEEYLNKWLKDYAEHKVRHNTFRGYKETIHNHIVPLLGKHKLQKLKPTEIQSLYSIKLRK
ncbi:Arm DNA-binding domain-containing protein [Clostridium formicaceticum]|uniref:Core-binding (CB) domain-containing protein n=1 Tax=Clostridium formicaceticum TaxID=1497 RepID=A0AAC9RJC5_9CLOT|nr:Arm DNA-binding domain-containing protein [Clostridium formicaceticum]AOY75837.1 hypothetical protein BJL90_07960 [Clostridium formicaceticum]ARE86168.1 hypothetical protein CLFO_04900 [Clostridium formicaceticum]